MATSGTFVKSIRTGYELRLVWNVDKQNILNNTSSITVKVQLVSTGSNYTINSSATKYGTLTIDGKSYSFSFSAALSGNQVKTIYTKSAIITHDNNGSKVCAFRAECGINVTLSGTYFGNVVVSGNGTFNAIPRASTPTLSPSTVTMGNAMTISISRASTAFTHTLTYSLGSMSGTIRSNVGTSATWNVPVNLANAITKSTTGIGTITCRTYNGSTLIGTKTVNFVANVPDSVVPIISNVAVSENTAGIAEKFGTYVQGKSALNISISAVGAYGSTISKYESTFEKTTYHKDDFVSDVITGSGAMNLVTTVTDSRGRTAKYTKTISVLAYSAPKITTFRASRANSDGTQNYEGKNASIEINFKIASLNNLNDASYTIAYRQKGTSAWTNIASDASYGMNDTIITDALFNGDLSYDLSLTLRDYFGAVQALIDIPTAFTLIDFRGTGRGIEFGAVSNEDVFGVSMNAKFRKNIDIDGNVNWWGLQAGWNSITPVANTPTSVEIVFDKPFKTVPRVVATIESNVPGKQVTGIGVTDITETGFTAWITRTNTTITYFNWIAIGV